MPNTSDKNTNGSNSPTSALCNFISQHTKNFITRYTCKMIFSYYGYYKILCACIYLAVDIFQVCVQFSKFLTDNIKGYMKVLFSCSENTYKRLSKKRYVDLFSI